MALVDQHQANKKRKLGPESVERCLSTTYKEESFSILWKLKNYRKIQEKYSFVRTCCLHGGQNKNHNWRMKVEPNFRNDGYFQKNHLKVSLCFIGFTDPAKKGTKVRARFEISLLDAEGVARVRKGNLNGTPFQFTSGSEQWHSFEDVVASDAILAKNSPLLVDETLMLHCKVILEGDLIVEQYDGELGNRVIAEKQRAKKRKKSFASELEKLYADAAFSDFTINTKTGSIKANKLILSARSPVFKAMLATKMEEAQKNSVTIEDFDHDVLEAFIKYLYCFERNSCDVPVTMACELLRLADRYMIADLKDQCEYTLADNVTVELAGEMLALAFMCNAKTLKPVIVKYIAENKEAVTKSEGFSRVAKDHPEVFADLFLASI